MAAFANNSVTISYTLTSGNSSIAIANSLSVSPATVYSWVYQTTLATAESIDSVVYNEYKGPETSRVNWS